jgi:hypothetical protein
MLSLYVSTLGGTAVHLNATGPLHSGISGGGTAYAYIVPLMVLNHVCRLNLVSEGGTAYACVVLFRIFLKDYLFTYELTHLYGMIQKQKMARCDAIVVIIT